MQNVGSLSLSLNKLEKFKNNTLSSVNYYDFIGIETFLTNNMILNLFFKSYKTLRLDWGYDKIT